jgi:hypothetical protein
MGKMINSHKYITYFIILLFLSNNKVIAQEELDNRLNSDFPIVNGFQYPYQENLVLKYKVKKIGETEFNTKGQIIKEFYNDLYQNKLTEYKYNDFDSLSKILILKTFGSVMKSHPNGQDLPQKDSILDSVLLKYDSYRRLQMKEFYNVGILSEVKYYYYDSTSRVSKEIDYRYNIRNEKQMQDSTVYKYPFYYLQLIINYDSIGNIKETKKIYYDKQIKLVDQSNQLVQAWEYNNKGRLINYYRDYAQFQCFQLFEYRYSGKKIKVQRSDFNFDTGKRNYYYKAYRNKLGKITQYTEKDNFLNIKTITKLTYIKNELLKHSITKMISHYYGKRKVEITNETYYNYEYYY